MIVVQSRGELQDCARAGRAASTATSSIVATARGCRQIDASATLFAFRFHHKFVVHIVTLGQAKISFHMHLNGLKCRADRVGTYMQQFSHLPGYDGAAYVKDGGGPRVWTCVGCYQLERNKGKRTREKETTGRVTSRKGVGGYVRAHGYRLTGEMSGGGLRSVAWASVITLI
eukprot:COSAG02_NODE_22546_length_748_cov_2.252696_1_plen_172_part_00